jgi:hypothetical protein
MIDAWYVVERGRLSFNIYIIKLIQMVSQWDYLVGQYGLVSSFTTIEEKVKTCVAVIAEKHLCKVQHGSSNISLSPEELAHEINTAAKGLFLFRWTRNFNKHLEYKNIL